MSLSAESETPLGEAQHSLLLNRWTLSTDSFSFISNISQKGRTLSALWGQEMLRASPLKPTRDSVPRPCKPLKRLDLNFKCLRKVYQLSDSFFDRVNKLLLQVSSETCRAIPRLGSGGSPPNVAKTRENESADKIRRF